MIKTDDAISYGRRLKGTLYSELDCINFIKKIIRTAPGGVKNYTTSGTNALWDSYNASPKYKDLTWRQMGTFGAKAGMLGFKVDGSDVHHVGLITRDGTILHSSSVYGEVVETALDSSWHALGTHRYIAVAEEAEESMESYKAKIQLNNHNSSLNVRNGAGTDYQVVGKLHHGSPVTVHVELDKWRYISYGDSGVGYVHADYVRRMTDEEIAQEEAAKEEPVEEPVENVERFTTLVNSEGMAVVLKGEWRVTDD